ncbi:uncharacterized protein [Diadema antillarum]|uniref:uncharacterized protein n=1 Tax=Diadema antillarum TaxID=105358 RepID=UPI003A83DDAD
MEQGLRVTRESAEKDNQSLFEEYPDACHAVAYDSYFPGSSSKVTSNQILQYHSSGPHTLSDLDISLPSTDLDLETKIFGRPKRVEKSFEKHGVLGKRELIPGLGPVQSDRSRTVQKSAGKVRRSLHMGESNPEDHVFHPEIVPFEPSPNPNRQSPKDPRYLLDTKSTHSSSVTSDPSTARYLRILIPQRDSADSIDQSASETSLNLFESLNTTAAERLLLESPTDSPSHFKQAQLRLDTADSEAETSVLGQDRDVTSTSASAADQLDLTSYYPPTQQLQRTTGKPSQEIKAEIYDLEAELKRLVLEIYSENEPDFAPVPGSARNMEDQVSQARSDLEKAFGGGDDFMNSYHKPGSPTQSTGMSLDAFNSLASTSDALALQKSLVGNSSAKPASMAEIAALLASVQQGQYQRDQSLSSLDSTLKSVNGSLTAEDTPQEKQYHSMSSLDETPSKIPADYIEPQVTPPAVNGGDHLPEAVSPAEAVKEEHSTPETGGTASSQPEGQQQGRKVVTVTKRPTSLLAQNTTLAISSAIAHKYKVPPPDEVLQPNKEPTLFRSPVQAITSSKGGRIAEMEGLETKQKPKKKKGKKSARKSAMTTRLMSDTDTEPPSDTELAANRRLVGENNRVPPLATTKQSEESMSDKADADQVSRSDQDVQHAAPPSRDSVSNLPSEETSAQSNGHPGPSPERNPLSNPESQTSSAPVTTPSSSSSSSSSSNGPTTLPNQPPAEPSSGSFLGSLFPWGRRAADKPSPSPPAANQQEEAHKGGATQEADLHSDSVDSGVDFVPGASGEMGTPTNRATRPEPLLSSTPNHVNTVAGRVDEVVPQRDTQQFSAPASAAESVHQQSAAPASYSPALGSRSSSTKPVDLGRLRTTQLPRPSYQSRYQFAEDEDEEGEDLQTVLREKAKLEGQLEMLMAETETALQARTQLQSQVAILQAKLKAQGSGGDGGSAQNRSALEADIASLKRHRTQLEEALAKLQGGLEAKEAELDALHRELHSSELANQRLQARLEEVRGEIVGKETTISLLEEKMSAMQEQVQEAKTDQTQSASALSSLQTDVESLTKARDWFQEQLGFAQDVRNQLQSELLASQTKAASQASSIETLKTENTKIKQQLTDSRQQALQEKEQIAKHLETIEADIVTREATFSAMQREKTAVQQAVFEQMDQIEEEKYRLAGLVASASELERQLEVARQELEAKHAALVGLEKEKRELVKGLALAEEALKARDTEMEALQVKCNNVEEKLREEQGKSTGQDEEVRQLRSDRAALEAALASANEEKRTFDESLQKLRGDLGRVEAGFKQMRQELGAKTAQLEETQMEGQQLKEQLKTAEKQMDAQQRNLEASIAAIGNKDGLIEELVSYKEQLEAEINALKRDAQTARSSQDSAQQANTGLQTELAKAREGFQMLEQQLQGALAENANLHGQLESLSEDQKQLTGLMDENAALRQRVADSQSSMHRELAEQKANVLRLGSDLSSTQKELKEKERQYEANIAALTRQLEDTSVAKNHVEKELIEKTAAAAQMSKDEQERLFGELQAVKQEANSLRSVKGRLENDVQHLRRNMEEDTEAYRRRIGELEAELQDLKKILDQQKRKEQRNRTLALDLERERGRLAGVHQSHTALKQHTGMLESALAQRESAVAELSSQLTNSAQDRADENHRLQRLVHELGAALEKERQASTDIKTQLANEKGETSRLRQELQSAGMEVDEVKGGMQRKDSQVQTLSAELGRLQQNEVDQKEALEAMKRELEASKAHMERLKRHLQDKDAQSPVLEDQMKTLAWQSEQKAREAESLREQLDLAEKRQQIELEGVKSSLQMTNQELEGLKRELASTRKEKFAYQAKLSQLKSALQATLQQNKLLKAKLKSKNRVASTLGKQSPGAGGPTQGEGKGLAEDIVVPEIAYDVESLLNSDEVEGVSASHSRPLYAIQSCLQSIKDQMGALDDQMKEHTAAVNTSSEAWKEVSNRVRDLRRASADPIAPATTPSPTSALPNGSGPATGRGVASGQPPRSSKAAMRQPQVYDL